MSDEETGIALIVVGIVLIFSGIFFGPLCGLGIVLIIIGIVLMAAGPSRAAYYAPPPAYPYAPPQWAPPPAPACPVCGTPLSWVPQYGRWYCTRCQQYR